MLGTLLILGGGPNVGQSVARTFGINGYNVAIAARSLQNGTSKDGHLHIQGDLSQSDQIRSIFRTVEARFGLPNVVVYNAHADSGASAQNPLSFPLASLKQDLAVNLDGAYIAAQEAIRCFGKLPKELSKVFIYTGNILNEHHLPGLFSLGVGKSAAAHVIESAAAAYHRQGYRFYYADERQPNGLAVYGDINGKAHAVFYLSLAQRGDQGPWLATFTKEKGYVNFKGSQI